MQSTLQTLRIRSGLYITTDGRYKIERVVTLFPHRRRWHVWVMGDGVWEFVASKPTLHAARVFVRPLVETRF